MKIDLIIDNKTLILYKIANRQHLVNIKDVKLLILFMCRKFNFFFVEKEKKNIRKKKRNLYTTEKQNNTKYKDVSSPFENIVALSVLIPYLILFFFFFCLFSQTSIENKKSVKMFMLCKQCI